MNAEKFIQDLFEQRYSINLSKIPETIRKTPDFEYIVRGERIFVAELKSLNHAVSEERGWITKQISPRLTESYKKKDNASSRLEKIIYEAIKQLRGFSEPKVLIILNEDPFIDEIDLEEALTGQSVHKFEDVTFVNRVYPGDASRRLSSSIDELDLVVFVDKQRDYEPFYGILSADGSELLRGVFGVESTNNGGCRSDDSTIDR